MFRRSSQATASGTKRKMPNKLIAGFGALSATAIIAASGFAAAAPNDKPTKAQCAQAGYTNYGQCVKEWAHTHGNHGSGYGGDTNTVNTNVNFELNHSNNNIIHIIVNAFH